LLSRPVTGGGKTQRNEKKNIEKRKGNGRKRKGKQTGKRERERERKEDEFETGEGLREK